MNLGSVCVRDVDRITPTQSVLEAVNHMKEGGIGCMVVIDASDIPVGVLTDRDVAIRVTATELDPRKTPVESVMTRDPVTASEFKTLRDGLELMRSNGLRRLLVTGEDGHLVGMVSVHDLLHHLMVDLTTLSQVLDQHSHLTNGLFSTVSYPIKE